MSDDDKYERMDSFYVSPTLFPEMFAIGILTYAVVAVIEYRKVRKIPMEEALKNVE